MGTLLLGDVVCRAACKNRKTPYSRPRPSHACFLICGAAAFFEGEQCRTRREPVPPWCRLVPDLSTAVHVLLRT